VCVCVCVLISGHAYMSILSLYLVPQDAVSRCLQRSIESVKVDGPVAIHITRHGTAGPAFQLLAQGAQPCTFQTPCCDIPASQCPQQRMPPLPAAVRCWQAGPHTDVQGVGPVVAPCSRMAASASCGSACLKWCLLFSMNCREHRSSADNAVIICKILAFFL
jgi:hypothetical protein